MSSVTPTVTPSVTEPLPEPNTCTNRACQWEKQKTRDQENEIHEHKKRSDFFEHASKSWESKYEAIKCERNGFRVSMDLLSEEKERAVAERDVAAKKAEALERQLAAIQKNLQLEEEASPFNTIMTMFRDPCLA